MSKKLTQNQKLDLIIAKLDALLTPKPAENPFETPGVPSGGQIFDTPIIKTPSIDEKVSAMDFSGFVDDPAKSYHAYVAQYGVKLLVYNILVNWEKRETFYEPVKLFVAEHPEYFG